jgi:hypothetical protein
MNYVLKKYNSLQVIISIFIEAVMNIEHLTLKEQLELTLCAKELGIKTPNLTYTIEGLAALNVSKLQLVELLIRQIVLIKYNLQEAERKEFINYWLEQKFYKQEDIVTIAWIIDICAMDNHLLNAPLREYIKHWMIKYCMRIHSLVVKSWFPHHLELFGELDLSKQVLEVVLAEQSKNGSWQGDFDKTLRIGYALSHSSKCPKHPLLKCVDFTHKVLVKGHGQNVELVAKLLKFYSRVKRIDNDLVDYLNEVLNRNRNTTVEDIKRVIGRGEIETAIEMLSAYKKLNGDSQNLGEVILQSSKLAEINKEYRLGKIEFATYNIEKTKITNGLLGLIDLL